MTRIDTDPIIETSINLRRLPFRPLIDCDETAVTVTLRPAIGPAVSSTAVSFALAWTSAINQLRGAALINYTEAAQ